MSAYVKTPARAAAAAKWNVRGSWEAFRTAEAKVRNQAPGTAAHTAAIEDLAGKKQKLAEAYKYWDQAKSLVPSSSTGE